VPDALEALEAPPAEAVLTSITIARFEDLLTREIEDILKAALDTGDTRDTRRHRDMILDNTDYMRTNSCFISIIPALLDLIQVDRAFSASLPLQPNILAASQQATALLAASSTTSTDIATLRSECRAIDAQCAAIRTDAIASQQTMADLSAVVTHLTALSQSLSEQLGKVAQQLQQQEVPPAPSAAATPALSKTKTFASVVGSGPAMKPQTRSSPSPLPASRRMAADRVSGQAYRLCFTVHVGSSSAAPMSALSASVRAEEMGSFLAGRLGTRVDAVLDAYPLSSKAQLSNGPAGPRRYFIRVATLADAEAIVANRHKLKDTGTVVFDELSPQERSVHGLLWPTFLAARKLGLTAQFQRARLVVTKVQADGSKSKFSICP